MLARRSRTSSIFFIALIAVAALMFGQAAVGQTTNASLAGNIGDQTGARIPGAKLLLVNQASNETRSTVANTDGDFNFSGVPSGIYTLTVKYPGFETFVEKGIHLNPGDSSELTIEMKIGAQEVTITVTAHDLTPTNGEVSSLITADDIQHLATEGRDVTELVKILPGFALQPGGTSGYGMSNVAPDTEVVGPGGALGNYVSNGSPAGGIALITDGANVTDPGASGASTQNINMDMVEEVKVSTSNFGADSAKGPVVINAVGKAGGQSYHGTVYIIARTSQLNSQDWLIKNQGLPKPHDRYLYPGFSVGGPVKIPGTNFNSQKKLLFLVGGEDYIQRNAFLGGSGASALHLSTVPTDCMRGSLTAGCPHPGMADFSQAQLAQIFNVPESVVTAQCNPNNPSGTLLVFDSFCQQVPSTFSYFGAVDDPQGVQVTANQGAVEGGQFPAADIDPGAAVYLNSLIPHANRLAQPVAGTTQPSDGFNRSDLYLTNYDFFQLRGRIDYNASQKDKFYAVYNIEHGHSFSPFTLYGNLTYTSGTLSDPSLIVSGVNSQTVSGNYVHIFGPTLTSESFAAASYYLNTFNPANETAQTTTTLKYPYLPLTPNGSKQIPQLGYSTGVPLYSGPDFSFGQSFSRKISLDFGDNVTKVYKQHTIKVGFYFERVSNNQLSAAAPTQGSFAQYGNYAGFFHPNDQAGAHRSNPDNTIAQFFFGDANYYSQETSTPVIDMFYTTIDGFVTDTWKITRRLTLDFGLRFDHLGPWTDPHNVGPAFWYPQNYITPSTSQAYLSTSPGVLRSELPGVSWHGQNSSVMDSVELGRWAFVSPRAGFAYDVFGNGKTIVNGGGGLYRSHDSWNDYVSALGTSLGQFSQYVDNTTLGCVDANARHTSYGPNCTIALAGANILATTSDSIVVDDPYDSQQPLTTTYSAGVNQAIKHAGNFVLNYVGNQSSHLLLSSTFAGNINAIPQGGLFQPDPNPQSPYYGQIAPTPDNITLVDDYRPYPFYNGIKELRHVLHSNYNALQATWSKWTGAFHYNINYTWSKALGSRGVDGNGNAPDATNLHNDYGIAAFDRTHAVNASYTYIEGKAFHVNRIASGFLNNWEFSGITNVQSGPNIQASYGNNFQLTTITTTSATTGAIVTATDNQTYLGTPDILLQPVMTCNPGANLHSGQFINSSCLTLGPLGVNGPFRYPYLRGPHFFNSDLSAQKSFHFSEKKELQIRYSAFNFLNHPLTSLVAATASPLRLAILGPGGPANSAFGISDYKQGRRVSEVTVRFNF